MTAPSNANTSGLEAEKRLKAIAAAIEFGPGNGIHFREEGAVTLASDIREVFVTAASAQARIAELSASMSQQADQWSERLSVMAARATAAEARADRLARFGQHTNWEMSHGYPDGEEEDGCWLVHSVNGSRNDREWTLIGRGETPDDALRLVPCPFCGGDVINTRSQEMTKGPAYYWHKCETCGAESEGDYGEDIAVAAWNRRAAPASPPDYVRTPNEDDRLRRALYRLLKRHGAGPDPLSVIGSLWDTLDQGECADLIEDWLITGKVIQKEGDIDEMLASIPKEPPASPLPGGGWHTNFDDAPKDGRWIVTLDKWRNAETMRWSNEVSRLSPEQGERGWVAKGGYSPNTRPELSVAWALIPAAPTGEPK